MRPTDDKLVRQNLAQCCRNVLDAIICHIYNMHPKLQWKEPFTQHFLEISHNRCSQHLSGDSGIGWWCCRWSTFDFSIHGPWRDSQDIASRGKTPRDGCGQSNVTHQLRCVTWKTYNVWHRRCPHQADFTVMFSSERCGKQVPLGQNGQKPKQRSRQPMFFFWKCECTPPTPIPLKWQPRKSR